MQPYQFGKMRAAKVDIAPNVIVTDREEERLPEYIQGTPVGSIPEARVAVALDRLKLKYDYQYDVFGGRRWRGGQIVDFMVYTKPLPTPLYVQGMYWHGTQKLGEDRLKQIEVTRLFKGQINDPLLVWENHISNVDEVYQYLKDLLF
jgi:hypothetical protein